MSEIRLSVVVPYWKRGRALRAWLENYAGLYGKRDDIEIVIVDDGSPTDPALPVIEEYRDKFACELRLVQMPIKQEGKDNCVVYNRGVAEARGEWVMLTQTDISHPDDVIDAFLTLLKGFPEDREPVLYPYSFCTFRGVRSSQFLACIAPDGITMRRSFYEKIGGFHEEYRDGYAVSDLDFRMKVDASDARAFMVVDVCVIHKFVESETWKHNDEGWKRNINLMLSRFPGVDSVHKITHLPVLAHPGRPISMGQRVHWECTAK